MSLVSRLLWKDGVLTGTLRHVSVLIDSVDNKSISSCSVDLQELLMPFLVKVFKFVEAANRFLGM